MRYRSCIGRRLGIDVAYSHRLVQVSDETLSADHVVTNTDAELDKMVRREIGVIGAIPLDAVIHSAGWANAGSLLQYLFGSVLACHYTDDPPVSLGENYAVISGGICGAYLFANGTFICNTVVGLIAIRTGDRESRVIR